MHLPPKNVQHHLKTRTVANGFTSSDSVLPLQQDTIEQPEVLEAEDMQTRPVIKPRATPAVKIQPRQSGMPIKGGTATSDSLPVLDAFQDFLAVERKRTKRRIMTLGFSFFAIILAVAAAGVGAGIYFLSPVRSDVSEINRTVALYTQAAEQLKTETQTSIETLSQVIAAEKSALDQAQNRVGTRIDDQTSMIEDLKEKLAALEKQNSALRTDIGRLSSDWPVMTSNYKRLMLDIERLKRAPPVSSPSVATRPAMLSTDVVEEETLTLLISEVGSGEQVSLRLPIPE